MVDDTIADPSACVARTVYNRPCEIAARPDEDVCEAHARARIESQNWWEWDDQEAAEECRSQQLLALRNEMLGVGVPVNTDGPAVLHIDDEEYSVLSGSRGDLRYSVTLAPEPDGTAIYQCACRGWMMNRRCSHIDQVIEFIGPDALPQKLEGWGEGRGRCSVITARGTRCRNTALEGVDYCGTHRPKVEAPAEVEPKGMDRFGTYRPKVEEPAEAEPAPEFQGALAECTEPEIVEEQQTAAKRTPWWRRWWMIIIWALLAILVVSNIYGAVRGGGEAQTSTSPQAAGVPAGPSVPTEPPVDLATTETAALWVSLRPGDNGHLAVYANPAFDVDVHDLAVFVGGHEYCNTSRIYGDDGPTKLSCEILEVRHGDIQRVSAQTPRGDLRCEKKQGSTSSRSVFACAWR